MDLLKKTLNKETILYTIFGVLTTVVDFLTFTCFHYLLKFGTINSNNISWAVAVLFAYITNKFFVFNSKSFSFKILIKEVPSFIAARVASLFITDIFLLFAEYIEMNAVIAKALISVAVVIMNYVFSKLFIFKSDTSNL